MRQVIWRLSVPTCIAFAVAACDAHTLTGVDNALHTPPPFTVRSGIAGLKADVADAHAMQLARDKFTFGGGGTWAPSISLDEYVSYLEGQLQLAEFGTPVGVALEEYPDNRPVGSSNIVRLSEPPPPESREVDFYATVSCYSFGSNTFAYVLSNLKITYNSVVVWSQDSTLIASGVQYASDHYTHFNSGPSAIATMSTKHYCDPGGGQKYYSTSSAAGNA